MYFMYIFSIISIAIYWLMIAMRTTNCNQDFAQDCDLFVSQLMEWDKVDLLFPKFRLLKG